MPPTFQESEHPRAADGKFTSGSAGAAARPAIPLEQRRTLAQMPAWHRNVGRVRRGVAIGDRGAHGAELPVGSFKVAELRIQRPKEVKPAEHEALQRSLVDIIRANEAGTIENGSLPKRHGKEPFKRRDGRAPIMKPGMKGTIMVPEGTPKRLVKLAYRHGAMIAMHTFGLGHYHFEMDDALKADMKPLESFIRYSSNRLYSQFTAAHPGAWKPYRTAFGKPISNGKLDADGNVRLLRPRIQNLVKAWGPVVDEFPLAW